MHIDAVPNRTSRPTYLLRESRREGKRVLKRTLANLSALSDAQIEAIRAVLAGVNLQPAQEWFEIVKSLPHGHVQAVRLAMQRLGFESLLATRPSRERDRVCAMVAARILAPHTKLATTRWWQHTTLAQECAVLDADERDLYSAMDWLLKHQRTIEGKLAARHLKQGALALYDLSSSYFEGKCCPLGKIGHSRDGKKNKPQVNYGLLTTKNGCPIAISVYEGNTADTKTLMPQVLVGDRGMISHKAIGQLRELPGLDWITALKATQIRALVQGETLQLGLFDEHNLFEFSHEEYPGERLIACRNPVLGRLRGYKREALLEATRKELEKIQTSVRSGRLTGRAKIGVRVGRVVNKYKVAKHVALDIEESDFKFSLREEQIAAEAALDGLYVIRTSVPEAQMSAPDTVRSYKALCEVERAFRSMKSIDLKIRPIHHWLADRVRAHILLCMLAYYVEWHMREAWRELMFADEQIELKASRDPVAPAQRSEAALQKVATHTLDDGRTPAHSFRTLLESLATIVRNTCRTRAAKPGAPTFQIDTAPNRHQQRAFELLRAIAV